MIGRSEEYRRMYEAEERMWWYRLLHGKTIRTIRKHFPGQAGLRMLDAGCGTGGMLAALRRAGFSNLRGFDFSEDGVAYACSRGFDVVQHDLTRLGSFAPGEQFDVIICHDVFCYFDEARLHDILRAVAEKLQPGGIFISNNNAFGHFAGIHDRVVGGRRFVLADIQRPAAHTGLQLYKHTYWSLVLSPLIAAVRWWQRRQLRQGRINLADHPSDVALPPAPLNAALYGLVRLEEALLPRLPWGSSLFTAFKRA